MTNTVQVLLVGEGPVCSALVPMVAAAGWEATLATSLAEVEASLAGCDAVVVLSHHEDVDAAAIGSALRHGTAYVGAMGSRRTQARRREWLLDHGWDDAELSSLRAPVGLDIGADAPGEIAISILAELVAVRRGAAAAGSLAGRAGPIHPDLPDGTAFCPGG